MIKRAVIRVPARGYVDGRYIGEEKEIIDIPDARPRGGKRRGSKASDGNVAAGNTTAKGRKRSTGQGRSTPAGGPAKPRKNSVGKKTPFRSGSSSGARGNSQAALVSPSEVADSRRLGEEAKSGQFAEALAAQATVKRERLHKILAQSGHGSRRDMEIMINSGRVMVNGIVATTGAQVSPGDTVLVDQRPIKLKFSEELPRVLLYHKPEGEIVTTSDPGNRITVFDNLPKVENGKWIAIGRLDINTSGLLIFTTSGELANRFMHPRYEVEREYAVRILGELSEAQTQQLLAGVNIDVKIDDEDEDDEESPTQTVPAKFDTIEKRGGEGANHWYHVTIKEGRNREVRKMFEAVGLTVSRLMRVRFGAIELPPRLLRGKMIELDANQVRSIQAQAGMKVSGPTTPLPKRGQKSTAAPTVERPARGSKVRHFRKRAARPHDKNTGVAGQQRDTRPAEPRFIPNTETSSPAPNPIGENKPKPPRGRRRNLRLGRGRRSGTSRNSSEGGNGNSGNEGGNP